MSSAGMATLFALLLPLTVSAQSANESSQDASQGLSFQRSGDNTLYYDDKGANFVPWIRRMLQEVKRYWLAGMPYSARFFSGHVAVRADVLRNGDIHALEVMIPSGTPGLDNSAMGALRAADLLPLPADYPVLDSSFEFILVFWYKERPYDLFEKTGNDFTVKELSDRLAKSLAGGLPSANKSAEPSATPDADGETSQPLSEEQETGASGLELGQSGIRSQHFVHQQLGREAPGILNQPRKPFAVKKLFRLNVEDKLGGEVNASGLWSKAEQQRPQDAYSCDEEGRNDATEDSL